MKITAKYFVVAYQQGKKDPTILEASKVFRHKRDAQEYAASLQQAFDESNKASKNGSWVILNIEAVLD